MILEKSVMSQMVSGINELQKEELCLKVNVLNVTFEGIEPLSNVNSYVLIPFVYQSVCLMIAVRG